MLSMKDVFSSKKTHVKYKRRFFLKKNMKDVLYMIYESGQQKLKFIFVLIIRIYGRKSHFL